MQNELLYLDYNATHPPDVSILEASFSMYRNAYGNTSGRSYFSQKSKMLLYQHKELCAELLQLKQEQILFSSSASESNMLILHSLIRCYLQELDFCTIFVTPFEHPSITNVLGLYENKQNIRIYVLTLQELTNKKLLLDQLKEKDMDIFICTHSHNETGICFPLQMISGVLREYSESYRRIFLLIDASQSLAKWNYSNVEKEFSSILNTSSNNFHQFWIFSGHKIGAGFGCSMIISSSTFTFESLALYSPYGAGVHEYGFRGGTNNLYSIIAFSLVLQKRFQNPKLLKNLLKCTHSFEALLLNKLKDLDIIGKNQTRYPGTTMLLFKKNIDIDLLLIRLDQKNITVSTGTSCKSGSREPSLGLLALGYSETQALSVLRLSYGIIFSNILQDYFVETMKEISHQCL